MGSTNLGEPPKNASMQVSFMADIICPAKGPKESVWFLLSCSEALIFSLVCVSSFSVFVSFSNFFYSVFS